MTTITPYATLDELEEWRGKPVPPLVDGANVATDRLLLRASEIIDYYALVPFDVDDLTGLPTDADIAATLRDAVCSQVDRWINEGITDEVSVEADRLYQHPKRLLQLGGLL